MLKTRVKLTTLNKILHIRIIGQKIWKKILYKPLKSKLEEIKPEFEMIDDYEEYDEQGASK